MYILSSWVNDGVCDCCDASDEWSSEVRCVDNCHELGREAYLEAQRLAELVKQGNSIRLDMISRGKQLKGEHEKKLQSLKGVQEEVELNKKEREELKKQAEEKESIALEKYKPAPEDLEKEAEKNDSTEDEAENYFHMLDTDDNKLVTIQEIQARSTFDKNRDGEVSEEEAKFFLGGQNDLSIQEFIDIAWNYIKRWDRMERGLSKPEEEEPQSEEVKPVTEETDESEERDEREDPIKEEEEGVEQEEQPPVGEPEYDEETKLIIEEAKEAREKYQEAERQLLDLVNEIRKVEDKAHRDYGKDEEFATLDGECFEYVDLEYIYSLCLFEKATQRSKSGGNEVSLGVWNEWVGSEDQKYTKMKYDRGMTCWNGPARSTLVTLKCGAEHKLTSVSEPNRCEYAMEFVTPALCNSSAEHVDTHDELWFFYERNKKFIRVLGYSYNLFGYY